VVGDGGVGKTCLLVTSTLKVFPAEFIPTVFDNYPAAVMVEDQHVILEMWETESQENYKTLRPLFYPQTDVFLVCFSLVFPTSLENVQNMWLPELKKHCPTTPCIIVGLKSDLRDIVAANPGAWKAKGMEPIPESKGQDMMKAINARAYIECSAKRYLNLNELLAEAIKAVLHPKSDIPIKVGLGRQKLEGIISYLTKKHGGNVHAKGIITITSKSIDDPASAPQNVADLTSDLFFVSTSEPGQWICWDFHKMRIRPTHYTIWSYSLKSWVVEGSLDGTSWTKIDQQTRRRPVDASGDLYSFAPSKVAEFRFIRLTQTEKRGLALRAVEFFGTLFE
jgi:Ras-related C3 botulinum toxin substrate 1